MEQTMPKIISKSAPHLRRPNASVTRMMRDVVIALLPLTMFAIYKFGMNAVWILLVGIISMVATEYLYYQVMDLLDGEKLVLRNKRFTLYNYSAMTSGLIYSLTLPDNTPLFVVFIGGALGMFLAKLVFGGMGQNIFNVAGVARVLVVINFGTLVSYDIDSVAGATALQMLSENAFNPAVLDSFSLLNLFTGMGIPGSIGEVSTLLIILGGIYLAFRTSFEVRIPLVYIGTVFVLTSLVAIVEGIGLWYPFYHIFSGGLMFGAVFMATDPITSPITKPARVYFGFALGFITVIIRLFGAYPEGVVFAILIMNMFVPTFDYYKWTHSKFTRKRNLIFASVVLVSMLVVLVGVLYA
ncbi:MAG: RnfABCDGE type electron transport complex subunit D [Candidatus Izemoplasmataceae bacterium]